MVRAYQPLYSLLIGGFNMLFVGLLLGFLSIVFIVLGLYNIIFAKRRSVINRLEIYTTESYEFNMDSDISLKQFILITIGTIIRKMSRKNYMELKQKKLNQAYVFMRAEEFLGISILFGLLGFLLIYSLTRLWYLALIGIVLGYKIPDIYVGNVKKQRMKKLNLQLPEALSILSNGLRAGFSFIQSMSVATNELDTPIKDEFLRIIRDNTIGKPLEEALIDFSERVDDDDVDMLVTALIIQRKVGGNLAEILDTIADTIRDRMRIRGEIKTLTAQSKLSAIIISILPFVVATMIYIMNPSYIKELFQSNIGIFMAAGGLVMQILGIFIMMKLADVEI